MVLGQLNGYLTERHGTGVEITTPGGKWENIKEGRKSESTYLEHLHKWYKPD